MRKQYFVLLLIGIIAIAGVMFTGCPETETTFNFENYTHYVIKVESKDLSPSSFELAGLEHEVDDPIVKKVTSTKSNPKFDYSRKDDLSGGVTDSTVKMVKASSLTYQFLPKVDFGDPSIQIAE